MVSVLSSSTGLLLIIPITMINTTININIHVNIIASIFYINLYLYFLIVIRIPFFGNNIQKVFRVPICIEKLINLFGIYIMDITIYKDFCIHISSEKIYQMI